MTLCPKSSRRRFTSLQRLEIAGSWSERGPMSKFGSPDDIAHTAVFLAMEPTGYMTGQVLTVDGGMVM